MPLLIARLGLLLAAAILAAELRAAEGPPTNRDRVLTRLEKSRAENSTAAAWTTRRKELREEFLKGAGLWPLPEKSMLTVITHSRREYNDYLVENVALETMPGFWCTGNLYRPLKQATPGPGILCPHGHFQPLGRMRPEQQVRCAQLARLGATVFSYSMVGWQDSQQTTHDDPLVLALQTWNSTRALDYLCSLPMVDTNRLGVTGASGGGTQTFFLAALDDRVRVSAPVVIVYPWAEPDGCRCEGGMPVMQTAQTDAIELAASVAPRPQLLISCGNDPTQDFPQVAFPFIQGVYALHGQSNLVQSVHFPDEGHDFGPSKRKTVYAFFAKHLGLPSTDEDLSAIHIEPPEKLAVFDQQHPLPAHAVHGSEQVAKVFHRLARSPAKPEGESFFFTPTGFAHEGQVARALGNRTGVVRITVRDTATGQLTPCRMSVIGPDGHFYQPASNHLTPYALTGQWPQRGVWGNRRDKAPYRYLGRFFYTTGAVEVVVPPGQAQVEVAKGFQFGPQRQLIEVTAGATNQLLLTLAKAADISASPYFGGDLHLHMPRDGAQDERTIFDLMAAEDIPYASLLAYNEPAGPYAGFMDRMDSPQRDGLGTRSVRERDGYSILAGQEYRSTTYGHLLLYLRDQLVFPGQTFNADHWPVYGEVERETRERGGLAIMAHGGYAQEIYADAALGTVNAVELLQFGIYRGIGLADWYHMLNCGYRFPITGASDWPASRFLGDARTFVHAERKPSFPDWLHGAAAGRSFVTTGPLLWLEIDGQKPGAQIRKSSPGPSTITVRLRVRCEVTSVTHAELIVNGEVRQGQTIPISQQRGAWWATEQTIELRESSWIAARAYSTTPGGQPDAEAHSNPIYVYFDGRAPYRQVSLDTWLNRIDAQIVSHAQRAFPEKARVLDYFQQARDTLLKIRERGGLRADDDPARLLQNAGTRKSSLDTDAGYRTPTDDELKTFLQPIPPKTPAEALKTFETAPGFHLELVAAEPLVYDPVAAAFDEDGNLYVCEMRDYPFKPADGHDPIGAVRLLRDTNGDGQFDQSTVFADKLLWAAGVAPWKGGIFVAAPPDIWYLKDTDGDGRADERRKVFTGFGTANQQAMLNNLTWWLDHKIYGSTAGNGGAIRSTDSPQELPIEVNHRDFRFEPVSGAFETISGTLQFGNTFDDWGNRFLCSESQPLQHVVLPQHYLARNPYLPVPAAIHNIAPGPVPIFRTSPIERWRQIRSNRRIASQERSAGSPGASHHVIDAAAGVTIYRGGAYPPQFYGSAFVGDGQNNLVHRRVLMADGVTFKSQRAEEHTEFVRSSDLWFRPVNFINAPDGTLYCLDMCREVLESIHIPLDVAKHLDLTSGRNYGRIYRIAPDGFRTSPPPRLSGASAGELAAALESPHGWWRDTAHRLIYERQDRSMVPALERIAAQSRLPQARLHALWSLQGLNSLEDRSLLAGLNDPHPGLRENAVRLAEPRLKVSPELRDAVLALAMDSDARVRFQVAFTLGHFSDPRATETLVGLAEREPNDPWLRAAVLSSAATTSAETLALLLTSPPLTNQAARTTLCLALAEIVGQRQRRDEVVTTLRVIASTGHLTDSNAWADTLLQALGRGLRRAGARLSASSESGSDILQLLDKSMRTARQTALQSQLPEARRLAAIGLLGCFPFPEARDGLVELLNTTQQPSIQIAAIKALADYPEAGAGDLLLHRWRQFTPDVRGEVLRALLGREGHTRTLLHAAERGEISLVGLEAASREPLLRHRSEELRALARRVFGEVTRSDRDTVVAEYRGALQLDADPKRGAPLFDKNCSVCHALHGKGNAVGPDLASAAGRDAEALLVHILDPNRYVLPKFIQYTVEDKQGHVFNGVIVSQTATSITLTGGHGLSDTILRADIAAMQSSALSLMPDGFETALDRQGMADLIAFLQASVPKDTADRPAHRERDFGTLPGILESSDKR